MQGLDTTSALVGSSDSYIFISFQDPLITVIVL